MFGDLVAAFGLTLFCLAPILLVSLAVPPVLLYLTRPRGTGKDGKPQRRNAVAATFAFTRFYFVALVVMVTLTVAFWWLFLLFTGTAGVVDFAAQSLPVEREVIEEAVEPAFTSEAQRAP